MQIKTTFHPLHLVVVFGLIVVGLLWLLPQAEPDEPVVAAATSPPTPTPTVTVTVVPTAAATPTPTPTLELVSYELPVFPAEYDWFEPPAGHTDVVRWLTQARWNELDPSLVRQQLIDAGWSRPEEYNTHNFPQPIYFATSDLNGDGLDEWIVTLVWGESSYEGVSKYRTGELLILDQEGVLYRSPMQPCAVTVLLFVADLTYDARDDLLIGNTVTCAMDHAVYDTFSLLTFHNGVFEDLSTPELQENSTIRWPFLRLVENPKNSFRQLLELDYPVQPWNIQERQIVWYGWDSYRLTQIGSGEPYSPVQKQMDWLHDQYQTLTPINEVITELEKRHWFREDALYYCWFEPCDDPLWLTADLDGDTQDKWIIRVTYPEGVAHSGQHPGDVWIVDTEGVFSVNEHVLFTTVSNLVLLPDMTGDGLPEILTSIGDCGSGSCSFHFYVISAHGGAYANIIIPNESGNDAINWSKAEYGLEDINGDGLPDLIGYTGGHRLYHNDPERPLFDYAPVYREVWSWDAEQQKMVLIESTLVE